MKEMRSYKNLSHKEKVKRNIFFVILGLIFLLIVYILKRLTTKYFILLTFAIMLNVFAAIYNFKESKVE